MENLIAIRDTAFWWMGVWALITVLNAAVLAVVRRWNARSKRHEGHKRTEKEEQK